MLIFTTKAGTVKKQQPTNKHIFLCDITYESIQQIHLLSSWQKTIDLRLAFENIYMNVKNCIFFFIMMIIFVGINPKWQNFIHNLHQHFSTKSNSKASDNSDSFLVFVVQFEDVRIIFVNLDSRSTSAKEKNNKLIKPKKWIYNYTKGHPETRKTDMRNHRRNYWSYSRMLINVKLSLDLIYVLKKNWE